MQFVSMTPARLRRIKEIFHTVLDCEAGQIGPFLDETCAGDEVLRGKIEALLASHQQAGSFIETPVAALAARIVEKEQADLVIGQTISHYKISKRIGSGGMGEVYLASDISVGRKAALKLLPTHLTGDAQRLKRFQQEARAVARLNHPNILTIYEVGTGESVHYIASELIEGETLRQRLARGSMPVGEAVEIAIQVAGALAAAHSAGVVHRDVKPANIMLRPDGYVKVLDFGIAKLAEQDVAATVWGDKAVGLVETNAGSILGTVSYMSPEQAHPADRGIDQRTDTWSLGVVLYEMAAGHAPFTGDTPSEVLTAILTAEPPPLSRDGAHAPDQLQQIITKALRKDPRERYQTANEMLEALKGLRRKLELAAELERSATRHPWLRWIRSPAAVVLTLLVGALAVAFPFYWFRKSTTTSTREKSVAVLPFENLSREPENAFFADGLHDEILTDLARIADLKVISRTSVKQYKDKPKNLPVIARQLGVAHVVEGTVQRSGNRVRVIAQLLDARADRHLWAQSYDRDLADVFAIQSEVAKAIAGELHAKLSPNEKSEIERPPTRDLSAFDLYTRANNLILTANFTDDLRGHLQEAADLLTQAVGRDPAFFQAYCQLAWAHDALYFQGYDHTPARLALAEAAIQTAFRLRPDAAEARLARAQNLYWGYLDYGGALAELEIAHQNLPNNAQIFQLMGLIRRRQGQWEQSARDLERALEFDPRDLETLEQIAVSYDLFRRYPEEKLILDRALTFEPNRAETKAVRANVDLDWKADTQPLHRVIDEIRAENPADVRSIADDWLVCALAERDAAAAKEALNAMGGAPFVDGSVQWNRPLVEGLIARMTKDEEKARAAFTAALAEQEKTVLAEPNYSPRLSVLGLINAALGRKEEALRQGRRAVELLPVEKDEIRGKAMLRYLAKIAAWVGDNDLACEQLALAAQAPSGVSYGQLKLMPWWDPLRGDPRFEKILASLAPKEK